MVNCQLSIVNSGYITKFPIHSQKFTIHLDFSHDCSNCLSSFFDLSRRRSRRDKPKNSECGKRDKAPYKNKDSEDGVKSSNFALQLLLIISEMCIFAKVYEKNTLHIGSRFTQLQQKHADPSTCRRRAQQK